MKKVEELANKIEEEVRASDQESSVPSIVEPAGELSTDVIDFSETAGEGSTIGVDFLIGKDIKIPKFHLIQSTSPFVKTDHEAKIDGAEEGDLVNLSSMRLYDGKTGIYVIPCHRIASYKEYEPSTVTKAGKVIRGDYITTHPEDSDFVKGCKWENRKFVSRSGTEANRVIAYYCIQVPEYPDENISEPVILEFASTQLNKADQWNQLIAGWQLEFNGKIVHPAICAGIYHLTTMREVKNDNDIMGWKFNPALDNDGKPLKFRKVTVFARPVTNKMLFDQALTFRQMVIDGSVTAAVSDHDSYDAPPPPTDREAPPEKVEETAW